MEIDDFLDVDNIDPLQLDLLDSVLNADPMSVVSVGRSIHHQFKTPDPPISSHPKQMHKQPMGSTNSCAHTHRTVLQYTSPAEILKMP